LGANVNNYTKFKAWPWRRALSALLLTVIAVVTPALSDQPTLYGLSYVRFHDPVINSSAVENERASEPLDEAEASRFREQLRQREQRDGPYAGTLAEPLSGLGHYHRERGDYPAALGSF